MDNEQDRHSAGGADGHRDRSLAHRDQRREEVVSRLLLAGLVVLIVFAPLFRGGYAPAATMLLQWLGLGLTVLVAWHSRSLRLRGIELAFLGLLFAVPLIYLVPLPSELARWLPARELYLRAQSAVDGELIGFQSVSVYPLATELSWMMLIVPIGVYLATRSLPESMQIRLVYVFLGVAVVQVLIALFQFATVGGVSYSLVELLGRSGSSGTYVNRNHLAGMIEMALPLALAMFLYDFGGKFSPARRRTGLRERVVAILKSGNRPSWIFALLAVLFTVGVIVTRSRTGIAMGMLGILITMILFSRRVGGRGTFGLIGQVVTISLGVAIFLGLAPVLDRFSVAELDADARWPMAIASFDAAGRLLPFGSGPGTYPDVFVLYQPLELGRWFINYAHNDYIQALFEVGVPGVVLIALFLVLYAAQWPRLVTAEDWSRLRSLQIGAGIAILLLLFHSVTDNNLRNPANLAYFSMFAGLYFSPPGIPRLRERPHRHRRRSVMPAASRVSMAGNPSGPANGAEGESTERRSRNPFDD